MQSIRRYAFAFFLDYFTVTAFQRTCRVLDYKCHLTHKSNVFAPVKKVTVYLKIAVVAIVLADVVSITDQKIREEMMWQRCSNNRWNRE
jgi:hypothetical protein